MPTPPNTPEAKPRFLALDYLRGFFIVVIIVDHLWRFPSLWSAFTGEARLWVTAAEGFIIISGFLIGYVRGYKGLKLPFKEIAKKLAARSGLLYLWVILGSLIYAAIDWYVTIVPNVPSPTVAMYDWPEYIWRLVTLQEASLWVYFLLFYAVFIMAAIPFVALLRRRIWWLAVIVLVALYALGLMYNIEILKWQIVFFLPALVGFYFPTVQSWWQSRRQSTRNILSHGSIVVTAALLLASFLSVYYSWLLPGLSHNLNNAFDNELMSPARVLFAFVVFVGYAFIFTKLLPVLATKWFGILHYFGTHSLTAYIAHGLILCLLNIITTHANIPHEFFVNTLLGALTVLLVYGFIRIPFVAKIIPR